jgi:hypothetical protein
LSAQLNRSGYPPSHFVEPAHNHFQLLFGNTNSPPSADRPVQRPWLLPLLAIRVSVQLNRSGDLPFSIC